MKYSILDKQTLRDDAQMEKTTMTTDATTATEAKPKAFRGQMKRALEYINGAKSMRYTPEGLAKVLTIPGMTAYRALRVATANGVLTVEKVKSDKKTRGPVKNIFVKVAAQTNG